MFRRQIRLLVGLLFGCSVLAAAPVTAFAQYDRYSLTLTVTSVMDGRPLRGAVVRLQGNGVHSVDDPYAADPSLITGRGLQLNETGQVTVLIARGIYSVSFDHHAHHSRSFRFSMPPPGYGNEYFLEFAVEMKMKEEIVSRSIHVTVLGESRDAGGNVTTEPLEEAYVQFWTDGNFNAPGHTGQFTNSNGVATSTMPYDIGSVMLIRATAEGYAAQEQTITVGSIQETAIDPRFTTRTTNEDYVKFTLRKAENDPSFAVATGRNRPPPKAREPENKSMVIEVVSAGNRTAIVGAKVEIEVIGGSQVASATTNAAGRTRAIALAPPQPSSTHAKYRAKVSAPGYAEAWSDIPDDLFLRPGSSFSYLIQLDRAASSESAANFEGEWDTMVGRLGYPLSLSLTQKGNKVDGTYTDGRGSAGTLTGTVNGDTLTYTWKDGSRSGTGVFSISRDGKSISGSYSEKGQMDNIWNGRRKN